MFCFFLRIALSCHNLIMAELQDLNQNFFVVCHNCSIYAAKIDFFSELYKFLSRKIKNGIMGTVMKMITFYTPSTTAGPMFSWRINSQPIFSEGSRNGVWSVCKRSQVLYSPYELHLQKYKKISIIERNLF